MIETRASRTARSATPRRAEVAPGSVSKAVFQQRFESPGKRRSRMNRASTDGAVLVAPKQEHGDTRKDATERTTKPRNPRNFDTFIDKNIVPCT